MASPVIHNIPADTWVKVAENVTAGQVWKISSDPNVYLQTYRATGEAAPSNTIDSVNLFLESISEQISATDPIDVYVYAVGMDGKVRVDA